MFSNHTSHVKTVDQSILIRRPNLARIDYLLARGDFLKSFKMLNDKLDLLVDLLYAQVGEKPLHFFPFFSTVGQNMTKSPERPFKDG